MQESLGTTIEMTLGQEFLTWLWYNSEEKNGTYHTIEGQNPYVVYISNRIVVRGGEGDAIETASVSGVNSSLKEAKLGLTIGKLVVSALVHLEKEGLEWKVGIKAEDFALNSFKTPAVSKEDKDDDNPDALFLEKIYFIEQGLDLINDCYQQFLQIRLNNSDWAKEVKKIGEWINL